MLPQTPQTKRFRHQWVLRRRDRPVVPCPEHTPLPRRGMSSEERARICSVYMRPWTLDTACESPPVPHLRNLNLCSSTNGARPQERSRLRRKTPAPAAEEHTAIRSFRRAWRQYLEGGIVSDHAAKIIKNFLLAVLAEGRHQDDREDKDAQDLEPEVPLSATSPERIHELIRSSAQQVENDTTGRAVTNKMQTAMASVCKMLKRVQPKICQFRCLRIIKYSKNSTHVMN